MCSVKKESGRRLGDPRPDREEDGSVRLCIERGTWHRAQLGCAPSTSLASDGASTFTIAFLQAQRFFRFSCLMHFISRRTEQGQLRCQPQRRFQIRKFRILTCGPASILGHAPSKYRRSRGSCTARVLPSGLCNCTAPQPGGPSRGGPAARLAPERVTTECCGGSSIGSGAGGPKCLIVHLYS